MRYLTRNASNRYKKGSSNLLSPYREQPRLTRIVVSSPRPLFSAAKRTHHAPIRFDQQVHNSQGHTPNRNNENGNIDVYGGARLELVRLVHEPSSSLPKPCASLKTPHESCPFAAPCWPSFFFSLFHPTYSRWTSSLPSCLWSQRIFPSLPGSRLTIVYRDASSALLQLVNQWLSFTYSRSHAFRYERKNTNPILVRTELTTSVLADVQVTH